jgi:hypothetical protein
LISRLNFSGRVKAALIDLEAPAGVTRRKRKQRERLNEWPAKADAKV